MLVHSLQTNLADPEFEPSTAEERMAVTGRDRYLKRQTKLADRGTAAERDDYSSVIRQSLLGVADRINAAIERDLTGRGKPSSLLLKLKEIGAEDAERGATLAYLSLSTIFSSLVKTNDRAKIATTLGSYVENEHHFHFISSQRPAMWDRLVKYAKEKGSYRHKSRYVLNTAARGEVNRQTGEIVHEGVSVERWSDKDRSAIGTWLVDLVEEAELIKVTSSTSKGHTKCLVHLNDHVIAWLEEFRQKANAGSLPMVSPVYAPMTEPPLDWSGPFGGGYRQLKYPLVKHGEADYRAADMSRVYASVNRMQRTAWRLNPVILALVEYLWGEGAAIGKLPIGLQRNVPDRLDPDVWAHMGAWEQKAWMLELRDIHDHNRQASSDLVSVDMILSQARDLQAEAAIYMPYQLDYRGRAYCQPLLNPQGPDYVRAMLEFSIGKPVGERGAMWLAIQVASLWDGEFRGKKLSKCSFQDRYDWTVANEALLRSVVVNPLEDRSWANADKPFMFLRTAMDWVSFLDLGESFVSHLPIALDGSCSGIQHYAAALRDQEVGRRVNLIPSEIPADVYGDVATMLLPELENDLSVEEWFSQPSPTSPGLLTSDAAHWWLELGVDRKTVKKPVMTYGYSSREPGFTDWYETEYVRPTLRARGANASISNPISRYLARRTLTAVEHVLPAVARGMDWLMACVSALAHEGKPIMWTAPSGFPVVQRYISAPSVRVETKLEGARIRVSLPGASKTINKEKQRSAISPNHTHSLDAAHLIITIEKAAECGVESFALIHDSFGTLAADTDAMFAAVRDAFVEMYEEHDPFQHLYDQVYEALSDAGRKKLPPPPVKGDLDLSQIRQSLYAFA